MEIKQRDEGSARIISVFGVIEERSLKEFDDVLAAHGAAKVVLDLTRLDYINSQGISVLLAAWRRARREGGSFVLGAPRGAVRKIFEIAHIGNFIPTRETIEEAIQIAINGLTPLSGGGRPAGDSATTKKNGSTPVTASGKKEEEKS